MILITMPNLKKPGGVANYFASLQNRFSKDVEYFIMGSGPGGKGIARYRRLWEAIWEYQKRIRSDVVSLVHLNPSLGHTAIPRDGLLLLMAKRSGCKVIVFYRGWSEEYAQSLVGLRLQLFKAVYSKADAFIVLGSHFERQLRQWGFEQPIYRETTTFDDKELPPITPEEIKERRNKSDFTILFLGRIEKEKGIMESLYAYNIFQRRNNHCRLIVAGVGTELSAAKHYVMERKIPNVEFTGYVRGKTKRELYLASDVLLFPTQHGEGMPNVICEAMAMGLAIITRPVGGITDFFRDGEMGYCT